MIQALKLAGYTKAQNSSIYFSVNSDLYIDKEELEKFDDDNIDDD